MLHFKLEEFDSPDLPGSGAEFMDEEEMITFAENEAYKIIDKINYEIKTTQNKQQ